MKYACYAGTRNIYQDMLPAAKSLLIHSDVDKIYFLIEDDKFPYELPQDIECINVSNQIWFDQDGPNYINNWSYMILLKAALTKLFPTLDKILMLDVDTIVNENISSLWDLDLTNYYFAATREPHKSSKRFLYTNVGVILFNLEKMREDGKDEELIQALNKYYYAFPEQDCFNNLCQGHIYELPADYNINNYTIGAEHRKIMHFAAIKKWRHLPLVEKYAAMSIVRNIPDTYGLDIIIPTYKNLEELDKTLQSVYSEDLFSFGKQANFPIQITVVDDCSGLDYTSLQNKYPNVNFLFQSTNQGPGMARQRAINETKLPYILFVDTGDYILSPYSILQIILTIFSNTIPYVYAWRWLNEEWNTYSGQDLHCLHGAVYKREFLELYHITFCETSSYSNEDVGFNRACLLIFKQLSLYDNTKKVQFFQSPIYMYTYDKNSITHKDNKAYMYTKQLRGLLLNEYHVVEIGKQNQIHPLFLWEDISYILVRLWYDFWYLMKYNPEAGQENWLLLRKYYQELYLLYYHSNIIAQQAAINQYAKELIKLGVTKINFNQFLNDLKNEEYVPSLYFDLF